MSKNLLEALDMLLGLTDGDPEKLKLISVGYKLGRGEEIKKEEPEKVPPVPSIMSRHMEQAMPPSVPSPSTTVKYKSPNRGLRATILRLLTTGPSWYDSLRKRANMEDKPLKICLSQLLDSGMIGIDKGGFYSLTSKGWPEANFFRANPDLKIRPAHPAKKI